MMNEHKTEGRGVIHGLSFKVLNYKRAGEYSPAPALFGSNYSERNYLKAQFSTANSAIRTCQARDRQVRPIL